MVSTPANGAAFTRRIGAATQSAECHVERAGKLAFYTGVVPASGEQIAVSYRAIRRAVGRAVNAASQQALAAQGAPATAAWIGTVRAARAQLRRLPQRRHRVDAGRGKRERVVERHVSRHQFDFAASVWPGDALALSAPSCNLNAQMVVRKVKLSYTASTPDVISYEIIFANDWADDLAIKTSASVPAIVAARGAGDYAAG